MDERPKTMEVIIMTRARAKELREFKRALNAAKEPVVTIDGMIDMYVMTGKDDGDYID